MAFNVDSNGFLQPLNVRVLRDNRTELLPATRDYEEEIPGKDGAFDFGCDLKTRVLELHCFVNNVTQSEWAIKRAKIAGYLNPLLGSQELTFANEPGKVYNVRYAGKIELMPKYARYIDFVIPFKMHNPYIHSDINAFDNDYEYDTGLLYSDGLYYPNPVTMVWTTSGQVMSQQNYGNVEVKPTFTVSGACVNPVFTNESTGKSITYTGTITASDTLIINPANMTATFNGVNAVGNVSGDLFTWALAIGTNNLKFTCDSVSNATLMIYYDHK